MNLLTFKKCFKRQKMIVHLSYTDLRNTVHLYKKRTKQQTKEMQYRSGGFEKKTKKKNKHTSTNNQFYHCV